MTTLDLVQFWKSRQKDQEFKILALTKTLFAAREYIGITHVLRLSAEIRDLEQEFYQINIILHSLDIVTRDETQSFRKEKGPDVSAEAVQLTERPFETKA